MLEVNQVLECKQLFGRGVPIREISRRLEVSRNTVRRYVRGVGKPGVYKMQNPRSQPLPGHDVPLEHALEEADRGGLVLEDQPILLDLPTYRFESQFRVEVARGRDVLDRETDREIAQLHVEAVHQT